MRKNKLPYYIAVTNWFHALLEEFAHDIADKNKPQYNSRIPYTTWRELKKPFQLCVIDVDKNNHNLINVKFNYSNGLSFRDFNFPVYDNSFGTWLYDHFETNPREEDNMNVDDDDMTQYEVNTITANTATTATPITANSNWTTTTTATPITNSNWTTTTTGTYTIQPPYTNYISTTDYIDKLIDDKLNERKEPTNKMEKTNDFLTFDFGPVNDKQFAASPYGIAVYAPETDTWLTYNADTNEVVDAKIFHFDVKGFFYKIPTPISNIKTGDIIIHMGTPMFVRAVNTDNTVTAVNYHDASVTTILPKKSPFGFNFITKVISLMNFDKMTADKDNPFGNMLPFFMMQDGKFDPMMLLFMNGGNMENMNPLLLYLMMDKKNDNRDMLPLMLMMSGGTFNFN